jgi:phosphoribosylanthranilate isomerase
MRTRVKICGLKEAAHVTAAVNAGADALGLNFYPPSVRYISLETARSLRAAVPAFVSVVALFVNPSVEAVQAVIDTVRPDLLQFHGAETAAFCGQFSCPYMKAVPVGVGFNLLDLQHSFADASAMLLDTPSAGHGGSGQVFDWSLISQNGKGPRLVLSGGLNAANVHSAIHAVQPYAVDVSSGVEAHKGQKDARKIREFMHAVRLADAARESN